MELEAERILHAVRDCVRLRCLTLSDNVNDGALRFTSAQLSACLPRLSLLSSLELESAAALTTLSFLTLGTLRHTLTALHLRDFLRRLPLAELQHVLYLRALRSLTLSNVFDEPLGVTGLMFFKPPAQPLLMPDLKDFEHIWEPLEDDE